jgi:hypothetical protein
MFRSSHASSLFAYRSMEQSKSYGYERAHPVKQLAAPFVITNNRLPRTQNKSTGSLFAVMFVNSELANKQCREV